MTETTITMPIIQTDEQVIPYEDDGKDRLAHIINKRNNLHIWREGMSPQDIVDVARVTGEYVIALCGHRFIPNHDPEKYPACPPCFEVAGMIISEDG